MPEIKLSRRNVRELSEFEGALKAALGDKYGGAVMRGDEVRLILSETADSTDRQLAAAIFAEAEATIDVKTPPPSVVRELKRKASRDVIAGLDIAALRERTASANSVQALRAEVDALWRVVGLLANLLGLSDTEVGE